MASQDKDGQSTKQEESVEIDMSLKAETKKAIKYTVLSCIAGSFVCFGLLSTFSSLYVYSTDPSSNTNTGLNPMTNVIIIAFLCVFYLILAGLFYAASVRSVAKAGLDSMTFYRSAIMMTGIPALLFIIIAAIFTLTTSCRGLECLGVGLIQIIWILAAATWFGNFIAALITGALYQPKAIKHK